MVRNLTILVLSLGILANGASGESAALAIDMSARLSCSEVTSGTPLHIPVTVRRSNDGVPEFAKLSFSVKYNVTVRILDNNGQEVGMRPKEPWDAAVSTTYFDKPLAPGDAYTRTLIVNRWSSTELPTGTYTVVLDIVGAKYTLGPERITRYPISGTVKPLRFPLKIAPPDDQVVKREFETLLEICKDQTASQQELLLAYDTLWLSQSSAALPYQLELIRYIYSENREFIYRLPEMLTMFRCIARRADRRTANTLAAFADDPVFLPVASGEVGDTTGLWQLLSWTIHEIHSLGDLGMREATAAFIDNHNPPKPFSRIDYAQGAMMLPRRY